jgi:hypothetical protein
MMPSVESLARCYQLSNPLETGIEASTFIRSSGHTCLRKNPIQGQAVARLDEDERKGVASTDIL